MSEEMITQCQHEGCTNPGSPCWLPDSDYDSEPDEYYCSEHAQINGYCYICGTFWAGVEMFDFGPGYCSNCAAEVEEPDYEDADWGGWDYYPEYEDILEDETGGRYIGPGSEFLPDDDVQDGRAD